MFLSASIRGTGATLRDATKEELLLQQIVGEIIQEHLRL